MEKVLKVFGLSKRLPVRLIQLFFIVLFQPFYHSRYHIQIRRPANDICSSKKCIKVLWYKVTFTFMV